MSLIPDNVISSVTGGVSNIKSGLGAGTSNILSSVSSGGANNIASNILSTATSSLFKKGGSIMEDLFGYQGATLVGYLDSVFADGKPNTDVIKYFYQQLYRDFAPDI